jgi:hypothetical protein
MSRAIRSFNLGRKLVELTEVTPVQPSAVGGWTQRKTKHATLDMTSGAGHVLRETDPAHASRADPRCSRAVC